VSEPEEKERPEFGNWGGLSFFPATPPSWLARSAATKERIMNDPIAAWGQNHRVLVSCFCVCLLRCAISPAVANIDLEWRPETQTVLVGSTVSIGLYAVSDDPEMDQYILAMDVILNWDPEFLELIGVDDNGPYDWLFSGFQSGDVDGLNDTFADGDALYTALGQLGAGAWATPEGLLVTTFEFTALAAIPETTLTIPEDAGEYTHTAVWGSPGEDVHGTLGIAMVTIVAEAPPGDCDTDLDVDLDDYSTFHDCLDGPQSGPVTPTCQCADLDEDDDVDLTDFVLFQRAFMGLP
jgi:hypothetical protein